MNTPQNQIIIIIIIIPIYEIFNTRCVNCARCQNCNRRMYIISSMEVLISLLIIHPSEPFSSLTGFFIPSFCKGCLLIGQQNVLVPLCTYVLKEFTIQIWKPNPNSTSRWSLFVHADGYYEMFIQVMKGHGIIIIGPRSFRSWPVDETYHYIHVLLRLWM
jgi:hypothetical protein